MTLIAWNQSLSVEIKLIDEQHQKLIGYINKLYEYMKLGKGKEVLGETLINLIDYTRFHFKTEEDLFEKYGYIEKDHHKGEHDAFVEKVAKFFEDYKDGKLLVTIEVFQFLSDWISNHIMKSDKKYTPFLKDKVV
jgi:hemerythrin